MQGPKCRPVTLAKNGVAHVQRCTECDCVSLHIGPTTLRIDAQVLEKLWSVLGEATASLHAQKQGARPFQRLI